MRMLFATPLALSLPSSPAVTEHIVTSGIQRQQSRPLPIKIANTDPVSGPVYVHCDGGRHRTGAMIAVYRMAIEGWDIQRAYREMRQYGSTLNKSERR